jgi:hypothetical protein
MYEVKNSTKNSIRFGTWGGKMHSDIDLDLAQ